MVDAFDFVDDDESASNTMWGVYTLIYGLLAWCVVLPPTEFISAGLTLDAICSSLLGAGEPIDFITYHVRRTTMNVVAHSFLPFRELNRCGPHSCH